MNAPGLVPLRGLAVGDPCTDTVAQSDSMDAIWYGHKMGLVPDQAFDFLWNACGARAPNTQALGGMHVVRSKIKRGWSQEMKRVLAPGPHFNPSPECKAAYRKFLVSTSKGLSQEWRNQWINDCEWTYRQSFKCT